MEIPEKSKVDAECEFWVLDVIVCWSGFVIGRAMESNGLLMVIWNGKECAQRSCDKEIWLALDCEWRFC